MQVSDPINVTAVADGNGTITVSWENAQTGHEFNKVEYEDLDAVPNPGWQEASATIAASDTSYQITGLDPAHEHNVRVTALNNSAAQVETIDAVADVTGSLDGLYFDIYDDSGPVRVWFDVDDSGTSAPATPSGGRLLEVTGISTGDSSTNVATAVASAIDADSEFGATSSTNTITITASAPGDRDNVDAGTSTFTNASTDTEGEDGDAGPVEAANTVYTWPDSAGYYWASRLDENATTWNHILIIEGNSPYLTARTSPLTRFTDVISDADLNDFVIGPQITVPAYVS